ncbi:Radical SAM domain protein [Methanocaldococcus infernus ME]|uniref:Radical SAM domain protein n=1 Tax=Methanocaldococcus infernus (strain DSM 11812 / JCM 15783 / ME) TaxID=573063 RepID=D5VRE2_METIM|nr:radical SAM protein [Methanocaldococcus infernus]ADG13145.1 Radical SAM domain protein [Methanocaldococcus infernus ME]
MKTLSICPICHKRIPAEIYEEDGKIWIKKRCEEHGEFKDIYWGDSNLYKKALKYWFDNKVKVYQSETKDGCPFDCGLCPSHRTTTILANIDVTNRCNLNCPICFANANKTGKVYEPSFEEIKKMMEILRSEEPPTPAIQFAGGEPTVREDLPELIKLAREMGFLQVQIATNGIRLKNLDYLRKLKEVKLSTIYLQFDGVTEKPYLEARGKNLLPLKKKVIENCRKVDFRSVVLVPTLVRGINDEEVGDIIRYAIDNVDVVRGINFQPVSFTGRINEEERLKWRITIPDFIKLVEEQTEFLDREDFYPVPSVAKLSALASKLTEVERPTLSCHPCCGVASYLIINKEKNKVVPLTKVVDIDGFLEDVEDLIEKLEEKKMSKLIVKGELLKDLIKHIDLKKLDDIGYKRLAELILNIIRGDYNSLVKFHYNVVMVGCMHFMDPYNFDIQRVSRCAIHYALPDGKIIPFCSFNTLYREEYEEKYSVPIKEWKHAKGM